MYRCPWFPIRNGAGEVTATAAIVHDITGRRRAEQARRDSEERFRTAFEHAPFGMCLSTRGFPAHAREHDILSNARLYEG